MNLKPSSILFGMWLVAVLFSPVYLFPSGLPQPTDFLIALIILGVFALYGFRYPASVRWPLILFSLFVYWVLFVNTVWAIATGNAEFLHNSAFYLYNFLVMTTCISFFTIFRDKFIRTTVLVIILSVCMVTALSFVLKDVGARQTVTFNNPNQLGYFSLLAASIVYLGSRILPMNRALLALAYACCAYLAGISLSKAAIISMGLLFLIMSLRYPRIGVAILVLMATLYLAGFHGSAFTSNVIRRLSTIGTDSDDNFVARGYDRILKYPQYIIFGAGEGAHQRFGDGRELHSSIGTVVFSYGVVGSLSFFGALYSLIRKMGVQYALALLPPLVYGLTHQGLRFTYFWILLAVGLCAATRSGSVNPRQECEVAPR